MKRIFCLVLMCALALGAFSAQAFLSEPYAGDLLYICNTDSAPLYSDYNAANTNVLEEIPRGEAVIYLMTTDRGYYVVHGNYAGYVSTDYLTNVNFYNATYYAPGSSWGMNPYVYPQATPTPVPTPTPTPTPTPKPTPKPTPSHPADVHHFPGGSVSATPNQRVSVRTGPSGDFTEIGTGPSDGTYNILYKVGSSDWVYVEYNNGGQKYRLYTTIKRFDTDVSSVKSVSEVSTEALVTKSTTAYFGPGSGYAASKLKVYEGQIVRCYFQQDGWLLVECDLSGGKKQRGWIAPGTWY